MAKKQFNTVPEGAAGASAAAAKQPSKSSASLPVKSNKNNSTSREPRISTAKHSQGKSAKDAVEIQASEALAIDAVSAPVSTVTAPEPVVPLAAPKVADARQAIEKLAYSYFESRGYRHGNPLEDWVRAEREYYGR